MNAALHTGLDAVARLAAARPLVVDVVAASEISAHHAAGGVTHAGPPIEPHRMCAPMRAALGSALWLEGVEFRSLVIGFDAASIGHGGEGALYVRVRRGR